MTLFWPSIFNFFLSLTLVNIVLSSNILPNSSTKGLQSMNFCLQHLSLSCSEPDDEVVSVVVPSPDLKDSKSTNVHFMSNGYIHYKDVYYSPSDYCVNSYHTSASICKRASAQTYPKCCPVDEDVDPTTLSCHPRILTSSELKSNDTFTKLMKSNGNYQLVLNGFPKCSDFFETRVWVNSNATDMPLRSNKTANNERLEKVRFRLVKGELKSEHGVVHQKDNPFCIDAFQTDDFLGNPYEQVAFICVDPVQERLALDNNNDNKGQDATLQLYGGLMLFCSIFLLITSVVYFLLWDKQSFHGWIVLSYSSSMFFFFVCIASSQFLGSDTKVTGKPVCVFIAVVAHFFYLSSFFWMSVVNFDLWTTFSELVTVDKRKKGIRKFLLACLVGWGIPIVIVVTGIVLDFHRPDLYTPKYGQHNCYITPESVGYYSFYPIGIVLILNLLLFLGTSWSILKIWKVTRFVRAQSSSSQRNSFKRSNIILKLLLVAGIPWMFEFISWLTYRRVGETLPWYIALFDVLNIFQAFGIFYIFVCKVDIAKSLMTKYPSTKGFFMSLASLIESCNYRTSNSSASTPGEGIGLTQRMGLIRRNTEESRVSSKIVTSASGNSVTDE